jgi:hypothetical protein
VAAVRCNRRLRALKQQHAQVIDTLTNGNVLSIEPLADPGATGDFRKPLGFLEKKRSLRKGSIASKSLLPMLNSPTMLLTMAEGFIPWETGDHAVDHGVKFRRFATLADEGKSGVGGELEACRLLDLVARHGRVQVKGEMR